MSDFDIDARHKRALDEVEYHEYMSTDDPDHEPDESVVLIVDAPGRAGDWRENVVIMCTNREQAEQVIVICEEDKESRVHVCTTRTTGATIIADRWAQADREMGDPNP